MHAGEGWNQELSKRIMPKRDWLQGLYVNVCELRDVMLDAGTGDSSDWSKSC